MDQLKTTFRNSNHPRTVCASFVNFGQTIEPGVRFQSLSENSSKKCTEHTWLVPFGERIGVLPRDCLFLTEEILVVWLPTDKQGNPPEWGVAAKVVSLYVRGIYAWVNITRGQSLFARRLYRAPSAEYLLRFPPFLQPVNKKWQGQIEYITRQSLELWEGFRNAEIRAKYASRAERVRRVWVKTGDVPEPRSILDPCQNQAHHQLRSHRFS